MPSDFDAMMAEADAVIYAEMGVDAVYTSPLAVESPCTVIMDQGIEPEGHVALNGIETHITLMDRTFDPEPGGTFAVGAVVYDIHQLLADDGSERRYLVSRQQ